MKNNSPKTSFSLYGIVCGTLGHDYMISRKVTNHINEYKCANCGREVTDTFSGRVEILTQAAKKANSKLAAFFLKKSRRQLTA
jgi:hypothetical protein